MATSEELNDRIQALPQELQDLIFEFTIAIKPSTVIIDSEYKPPSVLAINSAARQKAVHQYYSTSTFIIISPLAPLQGWLHSIGKESIALLTDLRCDTAKEPEFRHNIDGAEIECRRASLGALRRTIAMRRGGFSLNSTTVKCSYFILVTCQRQNALHAQKRWASSEGPSEEADDVCGPPEPLTSKVSAITST